MKNLWSDLKSKVHARRPSNHGGNEKKIPKKYSMCIKHAENNTKRFQAVIQQKNDIQLLKPLVEGVNKFDLFFEVSELILFLCKIICFLNKTGIFRNAELKWVLLC